MYGSNSVDCCSFPLFFVVVYCVLVVLVGLLTVALCVCLIVLMLVYLGSEWLVLVRDMVGVNCLFVLDGLHGVCLVFIGCFCGCFSGCRGDSW